MFGSRSVARAGSSLQARAPGQACSIQFAFNLGLDVVHALEEAGNERARFRSRQVRELPLRIIPKRREDHLSIPAQSLLNRRVIHSAHHASRAVKNYAACSALRLNRRFSYRSAISACTAALRGSAALSANSRSSRALRSQYATSNSDIFPAPSNVESIPGDYQHGVRPATETGVRTTLAA